MIQAALRSSTPVRAANINRPEDLQRAAIERAIETLVDLLDTIDGDCDLEIEHESYSDAGAKPRYGENQAWGPRGHEPGCGRVNWWA